MRSLFDSFPGAQVFLLCCQDYKDVSDSARTSRTSQSPNALLVYIAGSLLTSQQQVFYATA